MREILHGVYPEERRIQNDMGSDYSSKLGAKRMKAIIFNEFGGVDKLKYEDVPEPKAGPNDVVVQVKACALNHLDLWTRQGTYPNVTFPHITGSDVSGIVSEIGSAVKNIKIGDKVVISPGLSCMSCQQCLSGNDNVCRYYTVLGVIENGGYAEYVKVPAINILPMPESLNFNESASIMLVFLTAYHMLVGRAKIQLGEDVLIHAAGSGVGIAGIQISKLFGARVIATAGSDEKLEKAKELGADDVINYNKTDFLEEVRKLTGKKGVEIVFEHVGPDTWDKSIKSLAKNGRLVTCGATTGPIANLDLRYVYSKHLTILGSYMGTKSEMIEVFKFFKSKKLKPVIDKIFPLKNAQEAQKMMEDRKQFGKLVLNP
jgi:NADPH:quinone reductase-like Zn-dependent oxidoreductase